MHFFLLICLRNKIIAINLQSHKTKNLQNEKHYYYTRYYYPAT